MANLRKNNSKYKAPTAKKKKIIISSTNRGKDYYPILLVAEPDPVPW